MSKLLDLNVTYQKKTRLLSCLQSELPKKIEELFNVKFSDVILYAKSGNERHRVDVSEIKDVMKLEVIPKTDGMRSLRSATENGASPVKLANSIIVKLEHNSPLTGIERKFLIDLLQDKLSSSKKRKLDEDEDQPEVVNKPEVGNKKVQCRIFMELQHDYSTQTDGLNNALEGEGTTAELVDQMKRLATCESLDKDLAEHLMRVTFEDRRNFIILKSPPVSFINEQYPLLFNLNEVKNELDRLFYTGKCQQFLNNMKEYSKFILSMSHKDDEIYVLTQKCMKQCRAPFQKAYAEVVGSVFALSKLLKEEFRFIHLQDYPSGSEDVYPYIDASCYNLKDVFFDGCDFNVVVEGLQLCRPRTFSEAILCLISAFFIFNISYPESCRGTLICFEKLYLCANDTTDVEDSTQQIIKYLTLQVKESKKLDI